MLTPSKVAQYPELLPSGFNCPSRQADRLNLVLEWMAMLRAAGVHAVDTSAVLLAAHGAYPFRLFPSGGIHWNAVGAALAQQTVLDGLARMLPGRGIVPSPFAWHMIPHPARDLDDTDLARLLNLLMLADNGPVPAVTPRPGTPGRCRPPRVAIVGGSFSHATLQALDGMPCPVAATKYEYWHAYTLWWERGGLGGHPSVDGALRDAGLLAADVLIYEENEELLGQPAHGQALLAFLGRQAASVP